MTVSRYHTVLFDADNTLMDFFACEREALSDTLRAAGYVPTEELIAAYSAINDALWKKLERGEIDKTSLRTQRFYEFCEKCGLRVDVPRFSVEYTDHLSQKVHLMPHAEEVCRTLAGGCRLYLVTNGIKSVQERRFAMSPLRPYFQKIFISEEIGHEKPSRAYFEAVAHGIENYDSADTLLVGDSLTADMAGGIAAGIDTCWYCTDPAGITDLPVTYTVHDLREVPVIVGV